MFGTAKASTECVAKLLLDQRHDFVTDGAANVFCLSIGPKFIIGKLEAAVGARHSWLDRILVYLEVSSAFRVIALATEEAGVRGEADGESQVLWQRHATPPPALKDGA
jgi:hypothetical protein